MGNYIELNDLADAIKDLKGLIKRSSPVIDLVHCKECKNRGKNECPMHINGRDPDEEFLKSVDNDYCSYGIRKADDEKVDAENTGHWIQEDKYHVFTGKAVYRCSSCLSLVTGGGAYLYCPHCGTKMK